MISLIPVAYARNARTDRIFLLFAWISFISSTIAFSLMIGVWVVAKARFEKQGFSASYGPLVRIALFRFETSQVAKVTYIADLDSD